jgi:hypothetical protein
MKTAAATTTPKQTILSVKDALDYTTCILIGHGYKLNIHRRNPEPHNYGKHYNNIWAQNLRLLLTELKEPFYIKWDTAPFRQARHEVRHLKAIKSTTTQYGLLSSPEFAEFALLCAK